MMALEMAFECLWLSFIAQIGDFWGFVRVICHYMDQYYIFLLYFFSNMENMETMGYSIQLTNAKDCELHFGATKRYFYIYHQ
jgi:hypothetical protein